MSHSTAVLAERVLAAYRDVDARIAQVRQATGIACPEGCGACCTSPEVTCTVLEVLPLGLALYREGREDRVMAELERREAQGDRVCAMFRPDVGRADGGRCSVYAWRPLICRLFGFSGRRDKRGEAELIPCAVMRSAFPHAVARAELGCRSGLDVPNAADEQMRIASIDPGLGTRRLPINRAIREALAHLYWRRPQGRRYARAS